MVLKDVEKGERPPERELREVGGGAARERKNGEIVF